MFTKRQIRKRLFEALTTDKHDFYKASVLLRSDRTYNLTAILDNLRAVCNITIVSLKEPSKPLSNHVELTKLDIKFKKTEPSLKNQIKNLSLNARSIDGVHSFRITNVQKEE